MSEGNGAVRLLPETRSAEEIQSTLTNDGPALSVIAEYTSPRPEKMAIWVSFVAFLLGVYLLAVSAMAILSIFEVLTGQFNLVHLDPAVSVEQDIRIALMAGLGASLGSCFLCFQGLFRYAVHAPVFHPRMIGSYIIGPLAVVGLGIGAFVLIRAGMFVFGGVAVVQNLTPANEISFVALGILVGFAWHHVLAKLEQLSTEMFASRVTPMDIRIKGNSATQIDVVNAGLPPTKAST